MTLEPTVSLLIELPEALQARLRQVAAETGLSQDEIFTRAIALWLAIQGREKE